MLIKFGFLKALTENPEVVNPSRQAAKSVTSRLLDSERGVVFCEVLDLL